MEVAQSLLLFGEAKETVETETIEMETGVAAQTDLTSVNLCDMQSLT